MLLVLKVMSTNAKKYYLVLGGFVGFLLTFILGILTQKDPLTNMLHATISCVVGTMLMNVLFFVIYLHDENGTAPLANETKGDTRKKI